MSDAEADEQQELPEEQSGLRWFGKGARAVVSIPALILAAAFIGFAGLARQSGIDFPQTVFMAGMVWALPSLVVLVGSITSGASLLTTTIAVGLSAVRLLPMTIALIPVLRQPGKTKQWQLLLVSHFVAVTAWVFAMQKLPELPRHGRLPYFLGFAVTLNVCVLCTCAAAYVLIDEIPPLAAGALFFLTPVYFLLSLWSAAQVSADKFAMVFGLIAGPVFYIYLPGPDLLLTGLVGGSAAYITARFFKRAL
ncbi:MAG: AzlC family ABC transporter permease [Stappiaceae bacterium]